MPRLHRPHVLFAPAPGALTGAAPACGPGPGAVAVLPEGDVLALTRAFGRRDLLGVLAAPGLTPAEARRRALSLSLPPTLRRPLHPLLSPGCPRHSFEVDGYRSKAAVVAAVSLLAGAAGLRRRAVEAMEQALDEMLLNALLDAPVDGAGRPRYRHLPAPERVGLLSPPGERARVRCGGDGERFVVAVHDGFGSLRRATVLRYLARCAEAQALRSDPLEHRSGGAGVGLFLIASCATELLFRLRRGRGSEVVYAVTTRPGPLRLQALYIDDDGGDEEAAGEGGAGAGGGPGETVTRSG